MGSPTIEAPGAARDVGHCSTCVAQGPKRNLSIIFQNLGNLDISKQRFGASELTFAKCGVRRYKSIIKHYIVGTRVDDREDQSR